MKKTFEELFEIDQLVGSLYEKNPELKESKFSYAYNKFAKKNFEPVVKKHNEKLADIDVEYALENKDTGALLLDAKGNYCYSKEGQKSRMKARREIIEKTYNEEFEVEPYISTYVPKLTEEQQEVLGGIIVPVITKKK